MCEKKKCTMVPRDVPKTILGTSKVGSSQNSVPTNVEIPVLTPPNDMVTKKKIFWCFGTPSGNLKHPRMYRGKTRHIHSCTEKNETRNIPGCTEDDLKTSSQISVHRSVTKIFTFADEALRKVLDSETSFSTSPGTEKWLFVERPFRRKCTTPHISSSRKNV